MWEAYPQNQKIGWDKTLNKEVRISDKSKSREILKLKKKNKKY